MVTDHQTGKLRESSLFSVLGKTAALTFFSIKCWTNTDTEWLWWIVMVVLTAHELFSRLINMRIGVSSDTARYGESSGSDRRASGGVPGGGKG